MKKTLIASLIACALMSNTLAQGIITFSATGTSTTKWVPGMIGYEPDPDAYPPHYRLFPAGNPARLPYGDKLNIALYGAPLGTTLSMVGGLPDLSNWKIQTSPILQSLAADGYMTAKQVQMDPSILNAAGEFQLTVVAWTGNATSFMSAPLLNADFLAWTGDPHNGGALSWASGSGTTITPYLITKGPNAFNGLVLWTLIPEPSTFALAVSGALVLLVLRSRRPRF